MKNGATNAEIWSLLLSNPDSYTYGSTVVFLDLESGTCALKKSAHPKEPSRAPTWYCSHKHSSFEDLAWCTETPLSNAGEFREPFGESHHRPMKVDSWYQPGIWQHIAIEELKFWQRTQNIELKDIFNKLAVEIALGFSERRLAFEFCDTVINNLNGQMIRAFSEKEIDDLAEPF